MYRLHLPASINVYLGRTKEVYQIMVSSITAGFLQQQTQCPDRWGLTKSQPEPQWQADMNIENRKMIELTRALAADPDILILDEVTQSLSHDNREVFYELIKKFKELGRTFHLPDLPRSGRGTSYLPDSISGTSRW